MSVISERDGRRPREHTDRRGRVGIGEVTCAAAVRPEEYCRWTVCPLWLDRPGIPFLALVPTEPFHRAPCPPSRKVVPRRGTTCEGGWPWGRYARGHG